MLNLFRDDAGKEFKLMKVKQEQKELKQKTEKVSEGAKSAKELLERIIKEKKELQELYMQKVRFTLKNTSAIRVKRDQIARLLTMFHRLQAMNK